MENALELWHISPKASELREVPLKTPEADEVMIESVFSMVSCGTERIVSGGNVPEEVGDFMRVPHMKGFFYLSLYLWIFSRGYDYAGSRKSDRGTGACDASASVAYYS
ncbi:MAG: hypothetical protein HC905_31465 [Bacteroidales bacterium]|nr:hypothetical protein [Bacteroidales bacterium]